MRAPLDAEAGAAPVDEEAEKPDGSNAEGEDKGPPAWILAAVEQPRGLVRNEPGASPGYVLFTQFSADKTYLVDLDGRVVHTWTNEKAGDAVYLQGDGSLYRLARIPEPPNFRAGGVAGYIQRLSWESEVRWEWKMGDEKRMLHHDIKPLPNGNLLAIAWEQKTPAEARAAGRRVDLIPEQGIWSEWILEIEPLPPDNAKIVWEWHLWDHLVQNHDPDAANYGDPSGHPRRLDINADGESVEIDEKELEQLKALGYVPDNASSEDLQSDFLHMNSIDYHPGFDQIAVSVPHVGEIWILDHSTTTEEARGSSGGRYGLGGDLLYRWGNPESYGRGAKADQQLFSQHHALWIPDGFENAGHITVFNNGGGRPDGDWSSVVEIAPPVDDEGRYSLTEGEAFGPRAPVWTYQAEDRGSFFAPFVSGAHRLQNGNTFVCAGPPGRYFEVTPQGAIVWEYRNPFHGDVPGWNPPGTEQFPYASFRAIKIPPDHPGLASRALAPLDPQPPAYVPPPPAPAKQ
ncbi:MAG: aryl-sulfate sulfotransferase [Vicinamibacteria bacterium]